MQRFPEQTILTIESLRNSGWKTAIDSCDRDGYPSMWQALSAAARTAIEEGQLSEGKGLWLLADTCSLMLNPSSPNEPFKPFLAINGKRSTLTDDFQQTEIVLFSQFAEEVDDVWLQARLADLAWLLLVPRSPKHALLAIDAYHQIPIDIETWVRGGRECWERAISLTRMLKAGATDRMEKIKTAVDPQKL